MDNLLSIINTMRLNKKLPVLEALNLQMDLRDDLGFDSLDLAELTVRLENEYEVDVFEDGIITKVVDIINMIDK